MINPGDIIAHPKTCGKDWDFSIFKKRKWRRKTPIKKPAEKICRF